MEDKLIKIISLFTTFGLLVCSIYLFVYWSSFGINILEFITLSDFIKLGIYPHIVGVIAFVIGSLIGVLLPVNKIDETKSKEEQQKDIAKENRVRMYIRILTLVLLSGLTIFEYFKSEPTFWHSLGLLITLILIFWISDFKYLEPIIPNQNARMFITAVILAAVPFAFTTAKANAQDILSGRSVKIVNTKIIKEHGSDNFNKKGLLVGQDTLKFVGAGGEYFFFITMDNSVTYAVKYSDLHFLEFSNIK